MIFRSKPAAVAAHAIAAIQKTAAEIAESAGRSSAAASRPVATEYIPSGNTALHCGNS